MAFGQTHSKVREFSGNTNTQRKQSNQGDQTVKNFREQMVSPSVIRKGVGAGADALSLSEDHDRCLNTL
jgi:hypothetical protein